MEQPKRTLPGTWGVLACALMQLCFARWTDAQLPPFHPDGLHPYRAIALGELDDRDDGWARANAINNHGQVVGASNSKPFIWENGVMNELAGDGFEEGEAMGISDTGHVSGFFYRGGLQYFQAFAWYNGQYTEIPRIAGDRANTGEAVNDAGYYVGSSYDSTPYTGFIWHEGMLQTVPTTGSLGHTQIYDINNNGVMVGDIRPSGEHRFSGLRYDGTTVEQLSYGSGHGDVFINGINEAGDAVGWARGRDDPLLWKADGQVVWLDNWVDTIYSYQKLVPNDLNDRGMVVGRDTGSTYTAVVWYDGNAYDLNNLVVERNVGRLYSAMSVNNHNQIIGEYDRDSFGNGGAAYLAEPIPWRISLLYNPNDGALHVACDWDFQRFDMMLIGSEGGLLIPDSLDHSLLGADASQSDASRLAFMDLNGDVFMRSGGLLGYAQPGLDLQTLLEDLVLRYRLLGDNQVRTDMTVHMIPEPATMGLLLLSGLAAVRRRRA